MRKLLTACLLLLLVGCGDKAKDLFDTAQTRKKASVSIARERDFGPREYRW